MPGYMRDERDIACHLQPTALMTANSTFGVYAIVQRQLQWSCTTVRGFGVVQLQQYRYYSSYCDGTSPRSCAAGQGVLPEMLIIVTPPSSGIPPLFGQSASNRQQYVAFSRSVESTFSISWNRVSAPPSYSIRPSRKPATGGRPGRRRSPL